MRRAIATLAFLMVATWTVRADAAKTCREFTDPAELAQWEVENLIVVGPQGANGGVALFTTTGAQPARVTSPELDYMTLPDQIWYLCHAIYYLSPTYRGDLTIRWEYRLQGQSNFQHFIDVESLVGAIDPGECQLTFDISVFLEEGGIPAGSVIDQIRFTVVDAPRDVTFGLRGFCFADPDYNYRGLHAHDPTEVPWCGEVCYDGNNCEPGQEPECVEPSDCPAGQVCAGGRCNQPCEAQSDCRGEGFVCIPTGNYCAPPCESNLDCLQSEICVRDNPGGAVCLPRGPDGGFPGGTSGGNPGSGTGGDGAPCQGDSQCASRRCESGRCVGDTPPGSSGGNPGSGSGSGGNGTPGFPAGYPCQGDSQCASRRCESGRCTAPTGSPNPVCESDSQCSGGRICLYRQCFVPPGAVCQGDTSCAFGQRCLNGVCTNPTGANPICEGDSDCQYGTVCLDGQCFVRPGAVCQGDTSCAFGQRCQNGRCTEPSFEAECPGGDGDCGSGLVCVAGFCQVPPGIACTGDAQCSGLQCINGRCQAGRGLPCQGDSQCSNGQRCVSGRCTAPLPPGNFCEDDTHCAVGSYCINELCQRPCVYDSHCVGEHQCVGGYCQPPAVCVPEGGTVVPTNEPAPGGDAVCGPLGCVVNGEPTGGGAIGGSTPGGSSCGADQVCEGGSCKPSPRACISSDECNPGDACGGANLCENIPGACERNEDCPVGDACNEGWCGASCTTFQGDGKRVTFGCAPDQQCVEGVCTDGCTSDAECAIGYECGGGGFCVPTIRDAQERVRPGGRNSNSTGGGCATASGSPSAGLPWLMLLGAFLLVARSRRRAR